ncbi:hypothetical protein JK364_44690 [Streptomyces sp. 110]|uniref:Uncharacterized protein n=1 Tax=Streptomyces endocoffeicus TaxID=2898945 RepID=A0ABS1Q413_9ACTN|nr:hypothetical protein [Streptomyces endocoffeicus]MBL1119405.1 hypothetical protein [Streptomyces endocoffeicus]
MAAELAGGDRAAAFESAEQALAPHHPHHPVWFPAAVGVDPRSQDGGRGTAVLRPGPEVAERAEGPAGAGVTRYRSKAFAAAATASSTSSGSAALTLTDPAGRTLVLSKVSGRGSRGAGRRRRGRGRRPRSLWW